MKKSYILLLCFVASALNAGAIMEERPHPLTLNGKSFGNAITVNGNLAMSVEDFAKAATGTPNLGSNFVVRGNQLIANPPTQGAIILQNSAFHARKGGEVSSHLVTFNGKTFVPVVDVARALGARGWTVPANLQAGQPIGLNVGASADGVLTVGH